MPFYTGTLYQAKGGRLAKSYAKMLGIAHREGVLAPGEPNQLLGLAKKALDFLLRPNYAIAGVADVLNGTADAGDTVWSRVTAELLGKGQKETFTEVFEQSEQGGKLFKLKEMGRLSDVIGETFLSRHGFDPTTRGTIAMAANVFGDPFTYVGTGPGKVALRWIGKAGVINTSAKGQRLALAIQRTVATRQARALGRLDEYRKVVGTLEEPMFWQSLEKDLMAGRMAVKDAVRADRATEGWLRKGLQTRTEGRFERLVGKTPEQLSKADKALIQSVGADSVEELTHGTYLTFAGWRVAPLSAVDKFTASFVRLLRSHTGTREAYDAFNSTRKVIDRFFNRESLATRGIPGFRAEVQAAHDMLNVVRNQANNEAAEMWRKMPKTDEFYRAAAHWFDNPTDFNREEFYRIGKAAGDETLAVLENDWAHMMSRTAARDVQNYLLDPADALKYHNRYVPHKIEGWNELEQLVKERMIDIAKGSYQVKPRRLAKLGGYAEERIFDTLEELESWVVEMNKLHGTNLRVSYDLPSLMANRIRASMEAQVLRNLEHTAVTQFARDKTLESLPALRAILPRLGRDLRERSGLTEEHARILAELRSRSSSLSPSTFKQARREAAHEALESTDEYIQAMEWRDLASQLELERLAAPKGSKQRSVTDRAFARKEAAQLLKEAKTKAPSVEDIKARDLAKLRSLPEDAQAAFLYEMANSIDSLPHLAAIVEKYASVLENISEESLAFARKSLDEFNASVPKVSPYGGQPWVKRSVPTRGGGTRSVEVPLGVAEELESWATKHLAQPEVKVALRLFDWITNVFKGGVTSPWPAFHFRNFYSNVAQTTLDIWISALNPVRHTEAIAIMAGREGTLVSKGGIHYTYDQVRQLIEANGIQVNFRTVQELIESQELRLGRYSKKKLIQETLNPLSTEFGPVRAGRVVGSAIENEARAMHFITLLRRGHMPEEAAQRVKKYLFDYRDLSDFEKKYMRRIIPFYTWTSKNLRLQVGELMRNPGRVAAIQKPFVDRGPDQELLPEYLRGDLRVRLEPDAGKAAAFLTGIDLPFNNLDIIFDKRVSQTLRQNLGMLNPILKAPLEWAFNADTLSGRELAGHQAMGTLGPVLEKMPKFMQEWYGYRTYVDQRGVTHYMANGAKVYLTIKAWVLSRAMAEGGRFAEAIRDDHMVAGLWRAFTGMQFREFDLSEKQWRLLRSRYDRLEEEMMRRGLYQQLSVGYPTRGVAR